MASSVDIFMPLFMGDLLKRTLTCGREEVGAIVLLQIAMWQDEECKLQYNEKKLSRVCKCSESEFVEMWPDIKSQFQVIDGWVIDEKLQKEKNLAMGRRDVARKNGAKGGRPKNPRDNQQDNPGNNQQDNPGNNPDHNPQKSSSPSPSPTHTNTKTPTRITAVLDLWNRSIPSLFFSTASQKVMEKLGKHLEVRERTYSNVEEVIRSYEGKDISEWTRDWLCFEWVLKTDLNFEKFAAGKFIQKDPVGEKSAEQYAAEAAERKKREGGID